MNDKQQAVLQLLGNAMSDISEDCWCAGWLRGAEYSLPELCRRAVVNERPQLWGHGEITQLQAQGLHALVEIVGAWANLGEGSHVYVPFQPFPIPEEILEALDMDQLARL